MAAREQHNKIGNSFMAGVYRMAGGDESAGQQFSARRSRRPWYTSRVQGAVFLVQRGIFRPFQSVCVTDSAFLMLIVIRSKNFSCSSVISSAARFGARREPSIGPLWYFYLAHLEQPRMATFRDGQEPQGGNIGRVPARLCGRTMVQGLSKKRGEHRRMVHQAIANAFDMVAPFSIWRRLH